MRSRLLFTALSLALIVLLSPATVEAQCGTCVPNDDYTSYDCQGSDQPSQPPNCSGTMWFGWWCWTCEPIAWTGDAVDLQVFAVDGSVSQSVEYREAIMADTRRALAMEGGGGAVVVFPCTGAIAARLYEESEVDSRRRESARIVI